MAQSVFSRCYSKRSRREPLVIAASFSSSSSTSGGGGGGGVPRICSKIHLPRSTGEVRVGWLVKVHGEAMEMQVSVFWYGDDGKEAEVAAA